jgi:predicted GTPase
MGYGAKQVADLAATLDAADADLVLSATPIDLTRVLTTNKPISRVRYELSQVSGTPLAELLEPIVDKVRGSLVAPTT